MFFCLSYTSIRTPYKWYKTSFKMGLDYVLKGPSDYLQKVKRHRGVTQKNPFRWFEITVFSFGVFWIFLQPFFDFKTKTSSLLFLQKGCMLSRFFFKDWQTSSSCNLFSRIDLADCAADQFL